MSSKLAVRNNMFKTHDPIISEKNQLISQKNETNFAGSQSSVDLNDINIFKHYDLVEDEDEFVIDDILDNLTSSEFMKCLILLYSTIHILK